MNLCRKWQKLASEMRIVLLAICIGGMVNILSAKLTSAVWGTTPTTPVYAGHPYTLTLTLETKPNEEITGIRLEQGPTRPPDRQTSEVKGDRRQTILHWHQTETQPKIVAIPSGLVLANVAEVQVFGFMRSATTTQQRLQAEAFNYKVEPLPQEAAGAPVGRFSLKLEADAKTFSPGEVRLLTATLQSYEGTLPENYTFALKATTSGKVYPFRIIRNTEQNLIAQAYFVTTEATSDIQLSLMPLTVFDLASRTLQSVTCPPLTLQLKTALEANKEDLVVDVNASQHAVKAKLLRFAPSMHALTLGILEGDWEEISAYGEWRYVRTKTLGGWIRKQDLEAVK